MMRRPLCRDTLQREVFEVAVLSLGRFPSLRFLNFSERRRQPPEVVKCVH